MTSRIPVEVVRDMFFGQVKMSGEQAARMIYEKNYPYAAPFATSEEIERRLNPPKVVKVRKPYVLYTWPNFAAPVDVRPAAASKPQSRLARAKALYKQHSAKLDRDQMIALFMKDLGLGKTTATTYFYTAKK